MKKRTPSERTSLPSKIRRLIKQNNKSAIALFIVAVSCFAVVPFTLAASAAPAATDSVATPYGSIGKWMLQSNGQISNYGGQTYQNKTLFEVVNVIIVDPSSKSVSASTNKINQTMSAAGFPSRYGHSTGFKGLISGTVYGQQPTAFLSAYSDAVATSQNNHGRLFGPAPVSSGGYVYSGGFSTEKPSGFGHSYVASNAARDALARGFVNSGQSQSASVDMANAYNTSSTTTGDHDGKAIVITLK